MTAAPGTPPGSSWPADRFGTPVTFPTGVRWAPTDHKPIDQTPYLAYLDREEDKVRAYQETQ